MTKKGYVFIVLAAFLTGFLYLCPCAVAMDSNADHAPDSGRCCDRMPNCPQKEEEPTGIKILISAFSDNTPRSHVFHPFPPDIWKFHGNFRQELLIEKLFLFPADFVIGSPSPPALFIKHSTLLI